MFISSSQAATLFPNIGIQAEIEVSRSDLFTDSEKENNNTTSRTHWNRNDYRANRLIHISPMNIYLKPR